MKRSLSTAFLFVAAALQMACSGAGTMTVLLTDAPGDFNRAVVTIDSIYLQGGNGEGKVVLRNTPVTTDLLTLANDTSALLTDVDVPAGRYSGLRFVISGAYVEKQNGDGTTSIYASSPTYPGLPSGAVVAGDLQMPSYSTSGLKIDIGTVEVAGDQHVLLVDFDVAQSFGHDTGSSKWVLHPVIKGAELTFSGNVLVSLTRSAAATLPVGVSLTDLRVRLTNSGGSVKELPLGDADGNGTYEARFNYLLPGQFVIDFAGPAGSTTQTDPNSPISVTLNSGQSLAQSFTLLAW